ncbi:metallophosphoesterase [Gemmata sp. JC717]|uniref:metallophosphoesterase n=1 Tax=Gemmata algarum TaxID=2975278 RepID=UPI0021BA57F5|nr:metallophosphoesterase [Gemmata algarum]MDY3553359.1 metallophosphoesterase [Gemmata algarum]
MKWRLTRRQFLLGGAGAAFGVGVYTWRIEPRWVTVVRNDMPVRNLPPELDGKTLAQVSDLHSGPKVDASYLAACMRDLSALRPDIVVVTGDVTDHGAVGAHAHDIETIFAALVPPPLGTFAVLGNHDFGTAWSDLGAGAEVAAQLSSAGVTVLRNESRVVAGLRIAGVDDYWCPNFKPEAVFPRLDADEPTVVLCHNPDAADRPVDWGRFRGWILSGHTHGGQCKPPFLPPPLLPVANKRYTAGAFDLGDGRSMYINRGLGHTLRVRFNVRPEITLHRLVRV